MCNRTDLPLHVIVSLLPVVTSPSLVYITLVVKLKIIILSQRRSLQYNKAIHSCVTLLSAIPVLSLEIMAGKKKPRLLAEEWFSQPENREWKDKGFRDNVHWLPGGYRARERLKRYVWDGLTKQEREEWAGNAVFGSDRVKNLITGMTKLVRGVIVTKNANAKGELGEPGVGSKERTLERTNKYLKTENGRAKQETYLASETFQETRKAYKQTEAYVAVNAKYERGRRERNYGKSSRHTIEFPIVALSYIAHKCLACGPSNRNACQSNFQRIGWHRVGSCRKNFGNQLRGARVHDDVRMARADGSRAVLCLRLAWRDGT